MSITEWGVHVLQMSDLQRNLLSWDLTTMSKHQYIADARDTDWQTFSALSGWAVQGCSDKAGLTLTCLDRSSFGHVVATGDSAGTVKLQRFPCSSTSSLAKRSN